MSSATGPSPDSGDPLDVDASALADHVACTVAPFLERVEACDDVERLRAALRVFATALPDLMLTTAPTDAVVLTAQRAIDGTWP